MAFILTATSPVIKKYIGIRIYQVFNMWPCCWQHTLDMSSEWILWSVIDCWFTWRAEAWSSSLWAFLFHSSFSFLCLSSSAEYMAFSSDRRRDNTIITSGYIGFHCQTVGTNYLIKTSMFSDFRKTLYNNILHTTTLEVCTKHEEE